MTTISPLILQPILKEKVWGGRRLERLGKSLPPGVNIGESWEVADLGSTSVSGGGGGAERSTVAVGPHAGRTLHEMMDAWGDDLLPRALRTASGDFPLLVKFLDAREHLSIQVHPSPAYAAAHPGAHLKTECWYILDADGAAVDGAGEPVIYKGLRPGVTLSDLRRLIAEERVPEAMLEVPAIVGQMHDLPSGTIHALGAGVLVAEVQTPSDTTFRVYDWAREYGRKGRELHVEQSLACIDEGLPPPATALPIGQTAGTLVRNQFFTVDEVRLAREQRLTLSDAACQVLMVIGGGGTLEPGASPAFGPVPLALGTTLVLPASIAAGGTIVGGPTGIGVLRAGIVGRA